MFGFSSCIFLICHVFSLIGYWHLADYVTEKNSYRPVGDFLRKITHDFLSLAFMANDSRPNHTKVLSDKSLGKSNNLQVHTKFKSVVILHWNISPPLSFYIQLWYLTHFAGKYDCPICFKYLFISRYYVYFTITVYIRMLASERILYSQSCFEMKTLPNIWRVFAQLSCIFSRRTRQK